MDPDPQHCLQVVPRKLPVSSNNTFTETVGVPLVTTDSTLSPAHGTSHQPSAGWIGSHLPGITVVRLTAHLTSRRRMDSLTLTRYRYRNSYPVSGSRHISPAVSGMNGLTLSRYRNSDPAPGIPIRRKFVGYSENVNTPCSPRFPQFNRV